MLSVLAGSSLHFQVKHHALIFVLKIVAMDHVDLIAVERMRKVDGDAHQILCNALVFFYISLRFGRGTKIIITVFRL